LMDDSPDIARVMRAAEEHPKPDGERLEEYRESARASFEFSLFAEQPVYADLETLKLADSLTSFAEALGYSHPLVQAVLGGKSPRERAAEAVRGSKLASSAVRRQLYDGGEQAIQRAGDSMIDLARLVDADARAVRKVVEVQREAIRQAHAQIGKARYAIDGPSHYPDATSTLRLAFGTVKGYEEDGQRIPFETTFAGLYQRAVEQKYRSPFDLPQSWITSSNKLNWATSIQGFGTPVATETDSPRKETW